MHLKNISYDEMKNINKGKNALRLCQTKMILDSFIISDKYAMMISFDDEEGKEAIKRYLAGKDGRTMNTYIQSVCTTYAHYIKVHKEEYGDKVRACVRDGKLYLVRVDKTLTMGDLCQRRGYK